MSEQSMLRHVVLFQFKDGTPEDKVREIEDAFRALPAKIDIIQGFRVGYRCQRRGQGGRLYALLLCHFRQRSRPRRLPAPPRPHGLWRVAAAPLGKRAGGGLLAANVSRNRRDSRSSSRCPGLVNHGSNRRGCFRPAQSPRFGGLPAWAG